MKHLINTLLLLMLFAPGMTYAQKRSSSNDFFEPNYPGKIMDNPRGDILRATPTPRAVPQSDSPSAETTPFHEFTSPTDSPSPSPSASSHPTPRPSDIPRGTKVLQLGVIVHGADEKHRNEVLSLLANLSLEDSLAVGFVYLVGPLTGSTNQGDLFTIGLQGGVMKMVDTPPEPYQAVTHSPTWIVTTDKGEVLLEGVMKLSTYINPYGELTVPQ